MNRLDRADRSVRLAVSMGDPCGVGPEICVKLLAGGKAPADVIITVVGSRRVLDRTADRLRTARPSDRVVLDLDNFPPAMLDRRGATPEGGRASLEYIERAVAEVASGNADAVVTGPISKEAIGAAGSPYPGHTEMLAALTRGGRPVMMLTSGALRVAFATTHIALRDVPQALTVEGIAQTARLLGEAMGRYFGIAHPRIAVCALNPHAGDAGRFGDEEACIVTPAVERIRLAGLDVSGPLPSDTLFQKALTGRLDAVVALYHDQGMIPIKLSGVMGVVNITLGLPIIRTSPGHGTAYDIAGRGVADESSVVEAVRTAAAMVRATS